MVTVWWSSSRTTENTAPGSGSATRTSSPASSSGVATSYDGSSGPRAVSQTWTNRVCGAAATSECVTPEPVRSTATCPGSTRAGPVGPSCSSAPEITQVTMVRSAWSCGGNPSPTRSRWSSWQTIGPNRTWSASYDEPKEKACAVSRPACRSTNRSVPRRISTAT